MILTAQTRVVTPFGQGHEPRDVHVLARPRHRGGRSTATSVQSYLDGLTEQVQLIDKSDANLSGRSATIPVTVQNNLVQGVDHLVLRLKSNESDAPQDRRRTPTTSSPSRSRAGTASR